MRKTAILFSLLFIARPVLAATYYVDDANGLDTNAGTELLPWKTITKAQVLAVSGDTVLLKNGSYGEFSQTTLAADRTDWITYKSATGHSPVLTNIVVSSNYKNAYLRWEGLNLIGTTIPPGGGASATVSLRRGNYYYVYDCNITCQPQPIGEGGYYYPYYGAGTFVQRCIASRYSANYVTIENCDIHHAYRGIECGVDIGDYWTIKNNTIHRLAEDGVRPDGTNHLLLEGNLIYDVNKFRSSGPLVGTGSGTWEVGEPVIQAGTGAEGVIRTVTSVNSLIVYQTTAAPASFDTAAGGGGVVTGQWNGATLSNVTSAQDDFAHSDPLQIISTGPKDDIIIRGNTMIASASGTAYLSWYGYGTNVILENNLFWKTGGNAVTVGGVTAGLVINNNTFGNGLTLTLGGTAVIPSVCDEMYNNLFYEFGQSADSGAATIRCVSHGNNIFGNNPDGDGGPAYPFDYNEVTSLITADFDGLFVDVANDDYNLVAASWPIDHGSDVYGTTTDILGNARIGVTDIGAYEYLGELPDPENNPPILDVIGAKSVFEHRLLTFDVNASDVDGDSLIYSASVPLNLLGSTFVSPTFAWTPTYRQAGIYNVTFGVTDGNDWDWETVPVTVTNVPQYLIAR